jgi:hypothetical protein
VGAQKISTSEAMKDVNATKAMRKEMKDGLASRSNHRNEK